MIRRTVSAGFAALALFALPEAMPAQTFTPGDRVIYQENFSAHPDTIMRRLRNVHSRISFRAHRNAPGLHARTPSTFEIVLPERLPQRYTLEFDLHIAGTNHVAFTTLGANGGNAGTLLCGPHEVNVMSGQGDDRPTSLDETAAFHDLEPRVNHCAFLVEGDRVRAWVNNLPATDQEGFTMGRGNRLRVEFAGVEDPTLLNENIPVWLSNIRIAGFTQN